MHTIEQTTIYLQRVLRAQGFDVGAIDGIFGARTMAAVRAALAEDGELLPWMAKAKSMIGVSEKRGREHNPYIVDMWRSIGLSYSDDETPWCSAFCGAVLESCNIASTRSASARSYQSWGRKLDAPCYGCIVVFWRGSRQAFTGHVGFVVGKDAQGRLMVLGGNQGDAVSVAPFDVARVLEYRWPRDWDVLPTALEVVETEEKTSTNEA